VVFITFPEQFADVVPDENPIEVRLNLRIAISLELMVIEKLPMPAAAL
jgi:hypothetical protein